MLQTIQRCNRELFIHPIDGQKDRGQRLSRVGQTKEENDFSPGDNTSRAESAYYRDAESVHETNPLRSPSRQLHVNKTASSRSIFIAENAGQPNANNAASSRALSIAETTAHWSGISGPMTLAPPSFWSSGTQYVPPYGSARATSPPTHDCQRCRGGMVLYQMQSLDDHPAFVPLRCDQMSSLSLA